MQVEDRILEAINKEVSSGAEAARHLKYMKKHFDEQSELLFATFVNTDPKDVERLQMLVIHHKVLMDEQQFLQTTIDTGRLAQVELDKLNK